MRVPRIVLLALGVLGASLVCGALCLDRDPRPRFLERRGTLAEVALGPAWTAGAYVRQDARVTSTSGLSVEMSIRRPVDEAGGPPVRRPLLVLLGGRRSGRDAIDLIDETRGAVIAALSYPFDGDEKLKGWRVVPEVPAIRRALLDTPPAIQLAADFLASEPYVDATRIELVGVSLGAPFACIAGALDARFRRVWSIHGAGDPYALLEHGLEKRIPFAPARAFVAGVANVLASGSRLAPEAWVGGISPRPFVMVNGDTDDKIPRACIDRLYAAAREPREIVWRPGGHVGPKRKEIVQGLIDVVLERVER